ncbi:hypothetical protein LCGC14_0164590 [marine sediment metagenome]|uniref:Uncharacterized protein n=1 Tax=marine sediment metagenome TaxID=412755 RepID=A0A0F9UUV8_9ZZZZ
MKNKFLPTLMVWVVGYALGAASVGCIVGIVHVVYNPPDPGEAPLGMPIAGLGLFTLAFILGIILTTMYDTEKK